MGDERGRGDAAVLKYIKTFLERELVQGPNEAGADPQLGSIIGQLSERLAHCSEGQLFDVGCGHGSLLARLSTIPAFRDRPGWAYCPVDRDEKIDEVARLARQLKLLRRFSPLSIEEFAAEKPSDTAKIFFCRNVLHELKIGEAAHLIHSVCRLFGPDDVLIIQDLLRFPEGEHNHHCWMSDKLADALRAIGFGTVVDYEQGSKSGNAWFNVSARDLQNGQPTLQSIHNILLEARKAQWQLWTAVEAADSSLPSRDALIHALDMELQLASLTRELKGAGGLDLRLDPAVERRIRATEIVKRIEALAELNYIDQPAVVAPSHFRERGAQLTIAEEFLRSSSRLAVVHGGSGTGKTTFIQQLLANRLYEKVLVTIDARTARGVWPMLEQMFAQLGLNLAGEVISVVENLHYDQIRPAIGNLLNKIAAKLVVVVENIDEVIDSNQRFINLQIEAFLTQMVAKDGIKMIVSSRQEFLPSTIQRAAGNVILPTIAMGRYATAATVINVLDDFFDRARAGLGEYPATLIDAIDRHPLVAALAGRILQQDGQGVLLDNQFFIQLRRRLRDDLVARLVDGPAQAAMEIAARLRVPVPGKVLEALAGRQSVYHAKLNEIIYAVHDRRWNELLTSLGLFRKRSVNDLMPASEHDVAASSGLTHARIADHLERLYREDDDPKWIRESYYHRMLSGQTDGLNLAEFAGSYYLTELVASANYCFEKRGDFDGALTLYEAAGLIASLDETSMMRRASSLVRTGRVSAGNAEYRRLIADYPRNVGMRRSHVDALLYRKEFQEAREMLKEHRLAAEEHVWHARQWGRAELGLHHYPRAIEIFRALRLSTPDDPIVVTWLARALQQFGDLNEAIAVLRQGTADFPSNVAIRTSLAQNLERAKQDEEALPLLRALVFEDAGNARAALSLVRVLLRSDGRAEAGKVVKAVLRKADGSLKANAHMAQAEILLADDRPEAAAAYLQCHLEEDEAISTLLIDALLRSSERTDDPETRKQLLDQAAAVDVPRVLAHNVPVQVVLIRLAVARRDRVAFDSGIANLGATRLDPNELQRYRQLW